MKKIRFSMELEIKDDLILIWETGRQTNNIIFNSSCNLSEYTRSDLANFEIFLRQENQIEIADEIKNYLGKIIRARDLDNMIIADGNYKVNTFLDTMEKTIQRYIEEYGLNLDPDFQRPHKWTMKQRVAYIEFLLKGGKSNPIYFNCENWMSYRDLGEFVIVDGKQRLTSILMFLNDKFTIFKDLDKDGIGYFASEFDIIPNDIEFVINSLPDRKSVLQWYLQMNEGNVAHTEDELDIVRNMLKEN